MSERSDKPKPGSSSSRRRYFKKAGRPVVAVQLDVDTVGFEYEKWGDKQICKRGDWIVNNGGDVYTVDREVFARTYKITSPGLYVKHSPVWAVVADRPGSIRTKEGTTHYSTGDYLVYNDLGAEDGWAVAAGEFLAMYEPG